MSTLWDQGGGLELLLKIWEKIMRFVEEGDFVHTLRPRRRFGVVIEDLGEDHEIFRRKSETHHNFDH